ncbi:MAG TPA: LamG-like jellyroll fold domain-containing protein [Isosphaeraceae bacterium]
MLRKCLAMLAAVALPLRAGEEPPNAGRGAGTMPIWNPHRPAPGNPPLTVRVLVLNYDPIVPAEGYRRLSQVFGWNDPARLAATYKEAMEYASGGYLRFEIVQWRNLDEIYAKDDGSRYTVGEYVRNRRNGSGWGEHGNVDYPRLLREQNVVPPIDDGLVDEAWIFSDHFFGLWEASMAGPGSFFINGGVYPQVPSVRPFAFYGFNDERGVAEMIHDACHRAEATLDRVFGPWNLKDPKTPWDNFSAHATGSGGRAGVGTCHFPANGAHDYDYGNPRVVPSWADAYLTFPTLDFTTKNVSRDTWSRGPDYHLDYMKWYFAHVPRAAGVGPDGRQNNWLKYNFDFPSYDARGQAIPASSTLLSHHVASPESRTHTLRVAYRAADQVDPTSLDGGDLAVTEHDGRALPVRLVSGNEPGNRTYRVVLYEVTAPSAGWEEAGGGPYEIALRADEVRDLRGTPMPAGRLGRFRVAGSGSTATAKADPDVALVLPFEGSPRPAPGPRPIEAKGLRFAEGVAGRGAVFGPGASLVFPAEGSIDPKAGTVEVWVRPSGDAGPGGGYTLLAAGRPFDNGLLLAVDGASNLRLITWGDDPETPAVESNVERGVGAAASSWKSGQWHHVAATWGGADGKLALHVEGRRVAEGPGARIVRFSEPTLRIGGPAGDQPLAATLDELLIDRRPRRDVEVLADYESAAPPGRLAIQAPDAPLLPGARGVARAVALGAIGGETDLTRNVAWSSDAADVATINSHGTIRALQAGRATITARFGKLTASASIAVRDPGLPAARLVEVQDVTRPGPEPVTLVIAYADPDGIVPASVGPGDVRVVGPNGFHQFAELASIGHAGPEGGISASYRVTPPTDRWGPADRGAYTIELKGYQVADMQGNHVAEQVIGQFHVLEGGFR